MNILLVDDEPSYRMLMGDYLREQGWKVLPAGNGEEALQVLSSSPVDCIVSDVYMPVMDGLKFHKAVRDLPRYKDLPFIFVSAYDDPHTLTAIGASQCSTFLKKSRPPGDLKAWIAYLTTPPDRRPLSPPKAATETASRGDRLRNDLRSPRRGR